MSQQVPVETNEPRAHPSEEGVTVVIPALDEERAVAAEVDNVRRVLEGAGITHEIVVIDDGSSDETAERARAAGALVVRHPENRGYGASLKTGIRAARYATIVIIDADGTYPAEAIPEMLRSSHEYDMVVGARTGDSVHVPNLRKPAKWFLRKLAGFLAGRRIPDLNSGLRVMRRDVVERYFAILPSGFSFTTTITLAMLCNEHPVHYHPINYNQRVGSSKIRPAHAYQFFVLILRTMVFFNPLKVFLPIGGLLFVCGLGKFGYDVYKGDLSESAVLAILGAIIIWSIGLLSDQISRIGLGAGPR